MPANADDACVVYWVKTQQMSDPYSEGYVGITNNIRSRSKHHFTRNWPEAGPYSFQVLFEGTRAQCAHQESKYRPRPKMAWNGSNGGGRWRKAPNPSVAGTE